MEINDKTYSIDEKAAIRYTNGLKTFALELSFLNRKGILQEGWLTDERKINDYFVFVWINKIEDTIPTIKALNDGGISIAEITFRTKCAKEAIEIAKKEFPQMTIGAGTVINLKQAKEAIKAGAQFIVSPGFNAKICKHLKKLNILYIPGAVTSTEIMEALSYDLNIIKFFPASCYGGAKTIKALNGPFKDVKFVPTGGVDEANIKEYLSLDNVIAVGGSFMMKGDIKENTHRVLELIK
jgi:2-dehydro-3-deoxyphosphogluconate aldolase/(4S)-4-hydroxy-2-oxoglutarate aldolase